MMTVNFITFGKLRERYFRDACDEYLKRLSAFAKAFEKEQSPAFLPQNPSPQQIDAALNAESEKLRTICRSGFNIALCIEGKELSSGDLSKLLEKLSGEGKSSVNFIIGSSYGLAEKFKRDCDFRLSMSPMTFPHELARVMLFEQVYRALSITANSKYHK